MRRYRHLIRILISLIIPASIVSFTPGDNRSQYNVPKNASSGYACDLDLDGDNDIIIGHKIGWQGNSPSITILNNIYNGFFTVSDTSISFCGNQVNIFAIDLNNDGYCDIVAFHADLSSGQTRNYIRIFYNSKGSFAYYKDFGLLSSLNFSDITYGDVNGDMKMDLIVASNQDQVWGVLYNDGNGNFLQPQYYSTPDYYPTHLACSDLNNDGRDDVIVSGHNTEIYFSYPGNFQKTIFESSEEAWITDFDNDGQNDILTFAGNPFSNITCLIMYRNMENNSFEKIPAFYFQSNSSKFFVTDFNNDSLPDVLFQLDDNSGYVIYHNQNNFQLADSLFVAVPSFGEWWRNCYCADLDKNGFPDIITIRTSSLLLPANLDIKFNDGKGHFIDHPLGIKDFNNSEAVQLFRNYPNPFSYKTTIEFFLSEPTIVDLSIYDIKGTLIACLNEERMKAGLNHVTWNRVDFSGKKSPPGIYFAILKTPKNKSKTIKLIANQ